MKERETPHSTMLDGASEDESSVTEEIIIIQLAELIPPKCHRARASQAPSFVAPKDYV